MGIRSCVGRCAAGSSEKTGCFVTRRLDMAESYANALIGLAVSWGAVWAVFPLFGWQVTGTKSLAVSGLFFGLSWARAYVLRRVFRRLAKPSRLGNDLDCG